MNLHRFSFKNEATLTLIFVYAPLAVFIIVLAIIELIRR
jgi:hypothetical protein